MVSAACLGILVLLPVALAFKNPIDEKHAYECRLCPCYVHYKDRDILVPDQPYKVTKFGHSLFLDECLYSCQSDSRCRAVVWGLTGGNKGVTCEKYEAVSVTRGLQYTRNVDTYYKRMAMPCPQDRINYVRDYASQKASDFTAFEGPDGAAKLRKQHWKAMIAALYGR